MRKRGGGQQEQSRLRLTGNSALPVERYTGAKAGCVVEITMCGGKGTIDAYTPTEIRDRMAIWTEALMRAETMGVEIPDKQAALDAATEDLKKMMAERRYKACQPLI